MIKKYDEIVPIKTQFFDDCTDPMWKIEVSKLTPWLYGKGADIGAGQRSIVPDIIRVDKDPLTHPDIVSDCLVLPFNDCSLDYITSVHSFEHFDDQHRLLKECLRVLKSGGIFAMVHPDVRFTGRQSPVVLSTGKPQNPFNVHYHEHDLSSLKKQLLEWSDLSFKIVDSGVAHPNWSFYLIIQKL